MKMYLLALLIALPAFGAETHVRVIDLCRALVSGPLGASGTQALSPLVPVNRFEEVMIRLVPSFYIDVQAFAPESSMSRDSPSFADTSSGAVIFSLGEPSGDYSQELSELKQFQQTLHSKSKDPWGELRSSPDAETCVARASQLGLSDELLRKMSEAQLDVTANSVDQLAEEALQSLEQNTPEAAKNSVFPVSRWKDMETIISTLPTGKYDFVFLFHADTDGRLYDSNEEVVPAYFFTELKPAARSVTFFSCFPNAVFNHYVAAFSELRDSGVPVYRPSLNGDLSGAAETPVGLLPAFAEKLRVLLK
jgi:hypothetical protein